MRVRAIRRLDDDELRKLRDGWEGISASVEMLLELAADNRGLFTDAELRSLIRIQTKADQSWEQLR